MPSSKRPFHTLKADGPFIYERAEVIATATDRLASLGDPPTKLRLGLVRFRLEGIDTGWKVVSAERILPDGVEPEAKPAETARPEPDTGAPRQTHRSLGNPLEAR